MTAIVALDASFSELAAPAVAEQAAPLVYMPKCHSLDANSVRQLKGELEMLAERDRDIVFDLRHIDFMDSSGLGSVVFLLKRLQSKKRRLVLRHPTGQVDQLIKMLKLGFLIEQ